MVRKHSANEVASGGVKVYIMVWLGVKGGDKEDGKNHKIKRLMMV